MSSSPGIVIYTDPRYRNGVLVNESALLDEWLSRRYPNIRPVGRIRLGPTRAAVVGVELTPQQQAMLSVLNWYPDALVLAPGEQLIVEAKVVAKPRAIGEVLFYQRLLYATPELQPYMPLNVQPVVLFAEDDPAVRDFAQSLGVRVEIYTPPWIVSYMNTVQFRKRVVAEP
jgi:hypothetical protein